MKTYYNENNPECAEWLKALMSDGLIPKGYVDTRSITDVKAEDLEGYGQCHFFAGIGGWPLALRLAGYADLECWTGSCPCQPFSIANAGATGQQDERHLLPQFVSLSAQRRPSIIFGEQVRRAIRWGWLDEAFALLEASDYSCGAAVIPAYAVGASHERKRLFWMAHTGSQGWQGPHPVRSVHIPDAEALSKYGDPLGEVRGFMEVGDFRLLSYDGVPLVVARHAIKGFGNAIVPQLAAKFIQASIEAINDLNKHTTTKV